LNYFGNKQYLNLFYQLTNWPNAGVGGVYWSLFIISLAQLSCLVGPFVIKSGMYVNETAMNHRLREWLLVGWLPVCP
jgi:hypothetical protein